MAGISTISNGSALAAPDAFIDRRSGKPKRITAKIKKAVRLLLTGEVTTIKAAAERAKLHPDHLSRSIKQPHVAVYIDQATRDTLTTGKMLGAARLLELIRSKSDHVSFDASALALGIGGIKPAGDPSVALNFNLTPGYCIDMRDPREVTPADAVDPRETGMKTLEHSARGDDTLETIPLPAAPDPPDHRPPFPGYRKTGVDRRGAPIFSPAPPTVLDLKAKET